MTMEESYGVIELASRINALLPSLRARTHINQHAPALRANTEIDRVTSNTAPCDHN